jgi:hypothetical protein
LSHDHNLPATPATAAVSTATTAAISTANVSSAATTVVSATTATTVSATVLAVTLIQRPFQLPLLLLLLGSTLSLLACAAAFIPVVVIGRRTR